MRQALIASTVYCMVQRRASVAHTCIYIYNSNREASAGGFITGGRCNQNTPATRQCDRYSLLSAAETDSVTDNTPLGQTRSERELTAGLAFYTVYTGN